MTVWVLSAALLCTLWQCTAAGAPYALFTTPVDAVDKAGVMTLPGMAMIGGASDYTWPAMAWMVDRANGGDMVILRASGDDSYNDVFYDLSVCNNQTLNSVSTIVFYDRAASYDPAVLMIVDNAESVFFSGGDQSKYVQLWSGTPLQRVLQKKVASITMGGTSAGLAIQGEWIYDAENGSAYSDESLLNPYNRYITFADALLHVPFLQNVITDTHFSARDRMGRATAFLARLQTDAAKGKLLRLVAVDELTALLLDTATGDAVTVGPSFAFVCDAIAPPEICRPDEPLTFRDIQCQRLSGVSGDKFSFASGGGQGVRYVNAVVEGKFVSSPYGPQ